MTQAALNSAMRERPILFSGPMVQAILEGRKTQTRRVIQHRRWGIVERLKRDAAFIWSQFTGQPIPNVWHSTQCPYGQPGDRLWVRETWFLNHVVHMDGAIPKAKPDDFELENVVYRADGEFMQQFEDGPDGGCAWRSPIHMPRWASRLTLEITEVRVERLQEITDADARAEGCKGFIENVCHDDPTEEYRRLWDSLNAKRGYGWDANPFVWVISFKRIGEGV